MTTDIVKPPTPEILEVVDLVESGIAKVLAARSEVAAGTIGRFEAPVEGLLLIALQVRYLEGVCELARSDLVLLPAAMVLARSAFETGVRIMWLVHPSEDLEREARWLTHLKTEEDWYRRTAKLVDNLGGEASDLRQSADAFEGFRTAVTEELPDDFAPPKQLPNLREMLRSLGEERKYLHYLKLSQYSHATHHATGLYRRHLGIRKEIGEFVEVWEWKWVFSAAWPSFVASSGLLFVGALDSPPPLEDAFVERVTSAIDNIR